MGAQIYKGEAYSMLHAPFLASILNLGAVDRLGFRLNLPPHLLATA